MERKMQKFKFSLIKSRFCIEGKIFSNASHEFPCEKDRLNIA